MPDRRVPRGSKIDTPGGEGTDYPLNDGGVVDYREEKKDAEKKLREAEDIGSGMPKRLDSGYGIGGFGVKPATDVLGNSLGYSRRDTSMSYSEKFITLSYADVLEFVSGDSVLIELLEYLRQSEENVYNPPTREEFGRMLQFAIRREHGKIESDDIPSAHARASGRVLSSPEGKKDYADPKNMAFPVDSASRTRTAHAYIHKYWQAPSKKGVTATYSRDDFIRVHKKIVGAMKSSGIEHNYLDSLDDASGFVKKDTDESKSDAVACKHEESRREHKCEGNGLFKFREGQSVVSFARSRAKEKGTIIKIDGTVATVQWELSGLIVPELLAGLIPSY